MPDLRLANSCNIAPNLHLFRLHLEQLVSQLQVGLLKDLVLSSESLNIVSVLLILIQFFLVLLLLLFQLLFQFLYLLLKLFDFVFIFVALFKFNFKRRVFLFPRVNLVFVLTNSRFILLIFPKQFLVFSVFCHIHFLRLHIYSSLASLFQCIEFNHQFIIPLMRLVQFQNFGLELGL